MRRWLQITVLLLHVSIFMMLLGAAVYETFINFPNWFADIPASLIRTHEFLAVRHPGMFFQLIAPLTLITGFLFGGLDWRSRAPRNYVAAGVLLLVALEVVTFNLVYPRIGILLARGKGAGIIYPPEQLAQIAHEFLTLNAWRLAMMSIAAALSALGMLKFLTCSHGVTPPPNEAANQRTAPRSDG
jgi:hypothetical protein